MAGIVTALPGIHCVYYHRGRCFIEEMVNPGLRTQWRCLELNLWLKEYDRFLGQAEHFNLETEDASRIWERRLEGMVCGERQCKRYEPVGGALEEDEDDTAIACVYERDGLCVLEFPRCPGVCPQFVAEARLRKKE
jgi:hypothetical protein